ncbi:hypothetical protein M5689_003818 [Euphorbia peplus]|nr:hypothetical protein M5689_003818 [Euphorbia peplus]
MGGGDRDLEKVKWRRRRSRGVRCGGRSSVHMKVKKLQRLIPGGQDLQADRLFLKTADYILRLKSQIHFLKAISQIE